MNEAEVANRSDVLEKFLTICTEKEIFIIKKLKDIEKTCCPESELDVIDFDEVKRVCMRKYTCGIKEFQSCDAIKVWGNNIDFIEMKSFKSFLQYKNPHSTKSMINKNYKTKFEDSIMIMSIILKSNDLGLRESEISEIKSSWKNYYVLVDQNLSTPEEIFTRLEFLANPQYQDMKKIEDKIKGDIGQVGQNWGIKTKLIYKDELHKYFT